MAQSLAHLNGWLDIPDRHVVAAEFPRLEQAGRRLFGAYRGSDPILLYKAWTEVLGGEPPYVAQQIGDCVSMGASHCNDLLQCIEISLGEANQFQQTDTEFVYAASREIAGILSNQDGSFGSAAAKAVTQWGMVSRDMLGADGVYDGHRAKEWGRTGAPQKVKDMAKPFLLGGAALVKTWDELVAAITNGYPVTVASSQGFTMTRDENGFCQAHGTWEHQMFISAVRFDIEGGCVIQSWGPNCPDGPTVLGQPSFSFWAHRQTIERMLGQGDSWAFSRSPDFDPRPLPASWKYSMAA